MPPKKDAKKGPDLTPEEKMALIEQTLEGEKNNLVIIPVPSIPDPFPPPSSPPHAHAPPVSRTSRGVIRPDPCEYQNFCVPSLP